VVGDDPRPCRQTLQARHELNAVPASAVGDLWSPQTDAGVVAQVIVTLVVIGVLVWLVRREKALVQLVVGVGMVVLAWYGFRTIH
jgi:hypothetical protein